MPERPEERTLTTVLNGLLARVKSLEDNRRIPPRDVWFDGTCTAVRGEGEEVDPYQIDLKFDPDANNQIECREDGLFVGGGLREEFDALVDNTFVASDPDGRLFKGIGEALTYLAGEGFTHAAIAIRSTGTDYTETANWSSPANVHLFGIRGAGKKDSLGGWSNAGAMVEWIWNGFRPTVAAGCTMSNMYVSVGAMTGVGAGPVFDTLVAVDCSFLFPTTYPNTGASFKFCTNVVGNNCMFDFILTTGDNSYVFASQDAIMSNCDLSTRADSNDSPTLSFAQRYLQWIGGRMELQGSSGADMSSISLPKYFVVDITNSAMWQHSDGGNTGNRRFVLGGGTDTSGSITVRGDHVAADGWQVNTASTNFRFLELRGVFATITVAGTHRELQIDAANRFQSASGSTWDIIGPATIKTSTIVNGAYTFRGKNIVADVSGNALTGSSGAFVSMVDCDLSIIDIASDGAACTSTKKAYTLDASCSKNIVRAAGASTYPAASTDAGADNQIQET